MKPDPEVRQRVRTLTKLERKEPSRNTRLGPGRSGQLVNLGEEITRRHVELTWQGTNHTPDNIFIHFPNHNTLMLIDIVLPGRVPFYNFNLNEDVPASIAAPAKALSFPWKNYIAGHTGRLGTRNDLAAHQQYFTNVTDNVKTTLATVDPTPYFAKYGNNAWAAVKTYLEMW